MTTQTQRRWSAFHIFMHDSAKQDPFLQSWLTVKAKSLVAAKEAESWFFLRYWDGGPHLRIRFLNLKDEAGLLAEIQDAVSAYKADVALNAEDYYAGHSFDGEPVDIQSLEWHHDGDVKIYPYEPEYERYGGHEAIIVNEDLFYASSQIATAIINATMGKFEQRIQLSLKFIICSIFAVVPDNEALKMFATHYADFWRGHAQGVDASIDSNAAAQLKQSIEVFKQETINGTATGAIAMWITLIKQSVERFRKVYLDGNLVSPVDGSKVTTEEQYQMTIMSMMGSQIHMLNNRLGVSTAYEFVLSSRIRDALISNEG
ncbi:thiopeptide-type bacteriocin biosynthesis protein [Alteromonas sp. a30]|uniref:thiopeptide-type bacteriocin biosynthesis protein n=1 Tax=Alteromonas sp. a30 TaxID=2730917 RepID=UPI002282E69C|nr:thiopeptide-type bacteriocin biosynthesis protein [Alteromonas sp. a30]MCY7294749.1 hypothetical protein [Alteromonas sp. a30]